MHSWRRRESAGELSSDESPRVGALRQRPSVLPALETPSSKKGVGRLGGQTDRTVGLGGKGVSEGASE